MGYWACADDRHVTGDNAIFRQTSLSKRGQGRDDANSRGVTSMANHADNLRPPILSWAMGRVSQRPHVRCVENAVSHRRSGVVASGSTDRTQWQMDQGQASGSLLAVKGSPEIVCQI